jgi:hypothetical protein
MEASPQAASCGEAFVVAASGGTVGLDFFDTFLGLLPNLRIAVLLDHLLQQFDVDFLSNGLFPLLRIGARDFG